MKRFFAFFIALVMCVAAFTFYAAAYEASDVTGSMNVAYHCYSNYTIVLPDRFDGRQCGVILKNTEIEEGYRLEIHATNLDENGYLPLTHTQNADIVEYVSFVGYSYVAYGDGRVTTGDPWSWQLTNDETMLCSFESGDYGDWCQMALCFSAVPVGNNWKPGDYTGVLCYRIDCNSLTEDN